MIFNDFINTSLHKEKKYRLFLYKRAFLQQFENKEKYDKAGVYVVWEKNKQKEPFYVGETNNLLSRVIVDMKDTWNHSLRRTIGKRLGCKPHDKYGKRKFANKNDEKRISEYMESNLLISFYPIDFGRKELEEHLIDKFPSTCNRRIKRGRKRF